MKYAGTWVKWNEEEAPGIKDILSIPADPVDDDDDVIEVTAA